MSMIASRSSPPSERDSDTVEIRAGVVRTRAAASTLLRWLRRWMTIRHDPGTFSRARSHAQAVVLLAAAETERREGAADLPDASLRDGPPRLPGRSCPTRLRSTFLIGGQATRAAVLDAVAAGLSASAAGREGIRAPGIPWVGFSFDGEVSALERATSAPRPRALRPGDGRRLPPTTPRGSRSRQGTRALPTTTGRGTRSRWSGGSQPRIHTWPTASPRRRSRGGGAQGGSASAPPAASQLSALDACLEFFDAAADISSGDAPGGCAGLDPIPDAGLATKARCRRGSPRSAASP